MPVDTHTHRKELPQFQPLPEDKRLLQVEMENRRLQRLVAELLIKNHQLREQVNKLSGTPRQEVA